VRRYGGGVAAEAERWTRRRSSGGSGRRRGDAEIAGKILF